MLADRLQVSLVILYHKQQEILTAMKPMNTQLSLSAERSFQTFYNSMCTDQRASKSTATLSVRGWA